MTPRKPATERPELSTLPDELDYDAPPPGVFLAAEESELVGKVVYVGLVSEDHPSVKEFKRRAVIIEFEAIRGRGITSKSGDVDLIPGETYSLWLTSQTLHDSFVELAPDTGEVFAVRHFGRKIHKTRLDPKTNEPLEYSVFHAICPMRPKAVRESLAWNNVKPLSD